MCFLAQTEGFTQARSPLLSGLHGQLLRFFSSSFFHYLSRMFSWVFVCVCVLEEHSDTLLTKTKNKQRRLLYSGKVAGHGWYLKVFSRPFPWRFVDFRGEAHGAGDVSIVI